ncbi:MAG: ubiquinone biosynthesis regulatory protein kinase UbiB [Gammaproteobacteria bacterium]|nr:ubiquinone biosynthesis regulatory protein kinase UbiB [Gammaproteobacteria bacterium]MCP5137502.1 ubiquinone biosynthesis regulatory protein kinase UbiB [Gammaproteobacteria bacterium]
MIRPRVAWRLFHINFVLARHGLDEIVLATHLFRPVRFLKYLSPFYWLRPERGDHGARIRRALEDLGPIFVKFGQLLSTRADLLPEDIARELARLQDAVPPFAGATARRIVENAYKRPISEVFAEFDDKPLASASIAQVHAARLKDGRDVVVKVVRPNIEPVIGRDVELLKTLAALAERYWPEGRRLRPREVVAEFEKTLVDELDLTREAANASELRRNFEGSRLLYVPAIDWDHTFRRVMVMERITGIPIGDMATLRARGVNMKKLAERGVEIFFTQVFRDSFFHADMHPGNIFVDASDPENPRYVAVDFGIMGTLNPTDQHYLAANFLAFFNRDYRKVAELHVESLWVPATTRVDEFEAAIRTVSEPIFGRPLKEISFGHFLLRLFQTARRFDMRIQPQLVLLQKTLLAIEGLGRQLYPDLDLWQTAKPFLERWMSEQVGPRAAWKATRKAAPDWGTQIPEIPGLIHQVFSRAARGELQLRWQSEELQQLRQEVQESRRGTMRAITGAALFVGGCVLLAGDFSLPVLSQYSAGFAWLSLATGALMMFTGRGGRA